jgi:tetratricopeptide (TPR) repeat protein
LYFAQGKLGRAVEAYERALELEPTFQHRIRLLLELGDLLELYQRPEEAVETYRSLVNQFPDYPGRERVYEKIIPLLRQLNRPEQAGQIQEKIESNSGNDSSKP